MVLTPFSSLWVSLGHMDTKRNIYLNKSAILEFKVHRKSWSSDQQRRQKASRTNCILDSAHLDSRFRRLLFIKLSVLRLLGRHAMCWPDFGYGYFFKSACLISKFLGKRWLIWLVWDFDTQICFNIRISIQILIKIFG